MLVKGIWHYNSIWVWAMITNLHKIGEIGQVIWSLLPFAMVFVKLAYIFCTNDKEVTLFEHLFQLSDGFCGLNLY